MAELLLGIDVGNGSTKAVLARTDGTVVADAQAEHTYEVPRPGWAEMDPEGVWWHDIVALSKEMVAAADGDSIAAVGISALGPCLVPVDEDGRPLRKAILYGVDTRATEQIEALEREFGRDEIFALGGNRLTSQSLGPKIRWLREEEPDVYRDSTLFLTAPAWIVNRMIGVAAIDRHQAAHFTPLVDISTMTWSDRFAAGIVELERLAPIRSTRTIAGGVTDKAARETGLKAGTPVTVGAADTMAEAMSVGVVHPGDLMIMYGSTAFLLLVLEERISHPDLWTTAGAFGGKYGLTAGMAMAGATTRWFRNQLARDLVAAEDDGGPDAYQALADEAAESTIGARGLVLLPYLSGERTPLHDPLARGVIAGISLGTTRGDLFRAVLEGVAYGMRHNLETMAAAGATIERVVAIGGGAKNPLWLQIVSDVTGLTQHLAKRAIGAAYGDAFRAGLAVDLLKREDLDRTWVEPGKTIKPNADKDVRARYDEAYAEYRALYPASLETIHRLARRGLDEDE